MRSRITKMITKVKMSRGLNKLSQPVKLTKSEKSKGAMHVEFGA